MCNMLFNIADTAEQFTVFQVGQERQAMTPSIMLLGGEHREHPYQSRISTAALLPMNQLGMQRAGKAGSWPPSW